MSILRIEHLRATYLDENRTTEVLRDISLSLRSSEILAIRGPNGAGKTTLLNIIAGIQSASSGSVHLRKLPPTTISFVQQDYTSSLLPWFTVAENIALPLRLLGARKPTRLRSVRGLIDDLTFVDLPLEVYPHQLSGGQRQRVAIARALINQPHLLLLDEPFASLDGPTVRELQEVLLRSHARWQPSILLVSHDLDSTIYLADRVLLLHGRPATLRYELNVELPRPRTRELLLSPAFERIRRQLLAKEEHLYAEREAT